MENEEFAAIEQEFGGPDEDLEDVLANLDRAPSFEADVEGHYDDLLVVGAVS